MENYTTPGAAPQQSFQKMNLDGAGTVLTLGILSIVFTGLIGLILAIIALSKAKELKAVYDANKDVYTEASYKNMNAGRICAIISLSLLGFIVLMILFFLMVGLMA